MAQALTAEEETAVLLLVYEFLRLKERNASDAELDEWRRRVRERFPERREKLLAEVAGRLSQSGEREAMRLPDTSGKEVK
jgi:2-polyprenyl-6-methoxyphenol hydroxylase-like FAD-dependent oxidoreductase